MKFLKRDRLTEERRDTFLKIIWRRFEEERRPKSVFFVCLLKTQKRRPNKNLHICCSLCFVSTDKNNNNGDDNARQRDDATRGERVSASMVL